MICERISESLIFPRVQVFLMNQFHDSILGTCTYRAFSITPSVAGGFYSYDCEHGFGHSDFMRPEDVIDLAEKVGMDVHLAGFDWKLVGREGFGEKVSPIEARVLLVEARKAIGRRYSRPGMADACMR